jgi:hypothetical protein
LKGDPEEFPENIQLPLEGTIDTSDIELRSADSTEELKGLEISAVIIDEFYPTPEDELTHDTLDDLDDYDVLDTTLRD